ncbi:adenylate/guanylate cyclase domain-containing protein [Camelimonas fluminis]|uniref:Adenylate/guanylate cyclase domain-containing protein n=1 Tax=Camelimonas fluminis TaxID=1576911 RepID=A0ABV7UI59_9HYPH|nr:adenylate/guanylate cyclase domain-containing protein [Camelimonas fluminis]GHE62870.1 adenylate/guanylate cyclase domain-containing protein [Camelimonas fluminis]
MNRLLLGSPAQRLRLASGLVMFAFAGTLFLNVALGLVSLDVMEAVRTARTAVTRSAPGSIILGLALAVHGVLALARVGGKRSFQLRGWEWAQLLSGFAIPFLLIPHIVNTRVAFSILRVNDNYAYELARLWPGAAIPQSLLLALVWVHGCLGLHMWLREAHWYARWAPWLLSGAVLVPALALAGFVAEGRRLDVELADPAAMEALKQTVNWPSQAGEVALAGWRDLGQRAFYGVTALVLAVAVGRLAASRLARRTVSIQYLDGPTVQGARGGTILEIGRANGVPHLAVCGGRARCSTCRVRVLRGLDEMSPVGEAERMTLQSIGADADVRLACQAQPRGAVVVQPLLSPARGKARPAQAALKAVANLEAGGVERRFTVLFADIRGFTRLSESKLPYDTVFILNRVFQLMGVAIEQAGGRIEKYMGDGLLALFPEGGDAVTGATRALLAARDIDLALDQLNRELAAELDDPLRVAMGVHTGPLVVGRIGWGDSAAITVIGPTVNVASRIESIAKQENVQLAFSAATAEAAGIDVTASEHQFRGFPVKGVATPVAVGLARRARDVRVTAAVPAPETLAAGAALASRRNWRDRLRGRGGD